VTEASRVTNAEAGAAFHGSPIQILYCGFVQVVQRLLVAAAGYFVPLIPRLDFAVLQVLNEFTAEEVERSQEPLRIEKKGELVCIAEPAQRREVGFRDRAGVKQAEVTPVRLIRRIEKDVHERSARERVKLSFNTVDVWLAEIADVMEEESSPQARIIREAIQLAPRRSNHQRVQKELVVTE
jgi:hypothetical protein